MGLSEADMNSIITKWRKASPNIVKMWKDVEIGFKKALRMKTKVKYKKGIEFSYEKGLMFLTLPSGRRLAYVKPKIEFEEAFNRESLTYEGIMQTTGGWGRNYTWGGKLVENCLAKGTLVITERGLVPIEDIKPNDLVWDGWEMVKHEGSICQGTQPVLKVDNFYMTANHAVMTKRGWQFAKYADRYDWDEVSLPDGFTPCREHQARESSISVSETGLEKQVYDIRDCGPRHQFAIWDSVAQKARIVHNCVQATARDCLAEAMLRLEAKGYRIVMHIHDEVVLEMPLGKGSLEEACAIMGEPISWAPGLLLTADGYETDETANYYRKD